MYLGVVIHNVLSVSVIYLGIVVSIPLYCLSRSCGTYLTYCSPVFCLGVVVSDLQYCLYADLCILPGSGEKSAVCMLTSIPYLTLVFSNLL
jgi:hypothetical protein